MEQALTKVDRIVKQASALEASDKIILFYKIQDLLVALPKEKDKDITMKSAFGLWKNRNIDEKSLRKRAWKQR